MDIQKYRQRIKEILKSSDLETTTAKNVRKKIEQEYEVSLNTVKKGFDTLVVDILEDLGLVQEEEIVEEEDEVEIKPIKVDANHKSLSSNENRKRELPEELTDAEFALKLQQEENMAGRRSTRSGQDSKPIKKQKKKKAKGEKEGIRRKTAFNRPVLLSPALSELFGKEEMARTEVVKELWVHIKKHSLQDPKDGRFFFPDEELSKVFPGRKRISCFKMNAYLSDHLRKKEDLAGNQSGKSVDSDLEDSDEGYRKIMKKEIKKKPKRNSGKANGFQAVCSLSPELSFLCGGVIELPRTQIQKSVWDYIKKHDCQDRNDKRFIVCDTNLKKVLEVDRIHMFTMTKALQKHIIPLNATNNGTLRNTLTKTKNPATKPVNNELSAREVFSDDSENNDEGDEEDDSGDEKDEDSS